MCNLGYILLAVHLVSANFINTDLQGSLAGAVPNELRVYREYPLNKDGDAEQDLDEEGHMILVNCTIRSGNVDCTVSHDGAELEKTDNDCLDDEQYVSETEQEYSEESRSPGPRSLKIPLGGFPIEDEQLYDTEDSNDFNEQPRFETHRSMEEADRDQSESEELIPIIIEDAASHPRGNSEMGDQNFEVDEDDCDETSEATVLWTNEKEPINPFVDTIQQNNDEEKESLIETVPNTKEELQSTFRTTHHELSTQTGIVIESNQNFDVTEQKSIDDSIINSPSREQTQQNNLGVKTNSSLSELLIETRQDFNNTKDPTVRLETEKIHRIMVENKPKSFNQLYPKNPVTVDYRANYPKEEPEIVTNKTSHDANKQPPSQLSVKPADNSAMRAANNESISNKDSNATAGTLKPEIQSASQNNSTEFGESNANNATDVKDVMAFFRTMGWNHVPGINNVPGLPQRGNDAKVPTQVVNSSVPRSGNEYPLSVPDKINANHPERPQQKIMEHLKPNANPTLRQNVGKETPSYTKNSELQQEPRYAYNNPQSTYLQLNHPIKIWDFPAVYQIVPPQKNIWDKLEDATNIAPTWGVWSTPV